MFEMIDVSQEVMLIEALSAEISPSGGAQLLGQLTSSRTKPVPRMKEKADRSGKVV